MFRLVEIKLRTGVCFMRQPSVLIHIRTSQASRTALETCGSRERSAWSHHSCGIWEKGRDSWVCLDLLSWPPKEHSFSRCKAFFFIPQNCSKKNGSFDERLWVCFGAHVQHSRSYNSLLACPEPLGQQEVRDWGPRLGMLPALHTHTHGLPHS